jgi:hypothetical protein
MPAIHMTRSRPTPQEAEPWGDRTRRTLSLHAFGPGRRDLAQCVSDVLETRRLHVLPNMQDGAANAVDAALREAINLQTKLVPEQRAVSPLLSADET